MSLPVSSPGALRSPEGATRAGAPPPDPATASTGELTGELTGKQGIPR